MCLSRKGGDSGTVTAFCHLQGMVLKIIWLWRIMEEPGTAFLLLCCTEVLLAPILNTSKFPYQKQVQFLAAPSFNLDICLTHRLPDTARDNHLRWPMTTTSTQFLKHPANHPPVNLHFSVCFPQQMPSGPCPQITPSSPFLHLQPQIDQVHGPGINGKKPRKTWLPYGPKTKTRLQEDMAVSVTRPGVWRLVRTASLRSINIFTAVTLYSRCYCCLHFTNMEMKAQGAKQPS